MEVDGHSLWTCAFVSLLDLFSSSLVLRVHPNQAEGHWCEDRDRAAVQGLSGCLHPAVGAQVRIWGAAQPLACP